jgi:biopolymer transport protein ExbD
MLTGTFAVGQHYLQSNVATSHRPAPAGTTGSRLPADTQLEIRVDSLSQGRWSAEAGRVSVQSTGPDDRAARAALTRQLSKMRDDLNAVDTSMDKIQVVISPGRNTKYRDLVEVFSAAMDAKFAKIAFAEAR